MAEDNPQKTSKYSTQKHYRRLDFGR